MSFSKIIRKENPEPPSLGDLFGGKKGPKLDESELLDPVVESQRLQREGNVAPVDPNAAAEEDEVQTEPVTPTYPTGRPKSPFLTNYRP